MFFLGKYYFYDNYFDLPGALLCARVVDSLTKVSGDSFLRNHGTLFGPPVGEGHWAVGGREGAPHGLTGSRAAATGRAALANAVATPCF